MLVQQLESMTQPCPLESIYVLGVRVDRLSQQQALDRIEQIITQRRAGGNVAPCQQVGTLNTEFVMAAQRNPSFRGAINESALVLPDGIGVVWATHYLGQPAPERVTGTDTLVALAKRCAASGYRLYLLGAAPGVAGAAGSYLREVAPGLEIVGTYAGSPAPDEEDAIIERIKTSCPDVLYVSYGAPSHDLWIRRNLSRLPAAAAMGVVGAYAFRA